MPANPLSSPSRVPFPVPMPRWELALAQLGTLPEAELDHLARLWLTALGCRAIGRELRPEPLLAYTAALGEPPLAVPVQARLYRRRQRLLPHHVEAFVGHLGRTGHAVGLLATTGPVSEGARRAAEAGGLPRVRLLSGEEWLHDLAFHRIGVTFQSVPVWLLRPAGGARPSPDGRRRR